MGHNLYDPAKMSGPTSFGPKYGYEECWGAGPGGKTTNIENNEKGILEEGLQMVISRHQNSYMSSDHDTYKQAIYRTMSVGDND